MPNKMLIDASHPEETRVVVVRGSRIEEFDFESQDKKQLKGNIYLARVTRVEPSLQAAFVEYGGNRHGFLAFSEIHPDYYQIPVADRQALIRAETEAAEADNDDDEERSSDKRGKRRRRGRGRGRSEAEASDGENTENDSDGDEHEDANASGEDANDADDGDADPDEHQGDDAAGDSGDAANPAVMAEMADSDTISEPVAKNRDKDDGNGASSDDGDIESVGADDAMEEVHSRRKPVRRNYKIQEVVKRRQILLVQVVKEERGNKGAALTTYLSLAGRYSVLMPNTARGGGISRKITNVQDRKRLKDMVKELEVPTGMGVILRTAGESRTKAEIKRDYEYLLRMWENVRALTLQSSAPALVYEEGSLIKRSVRDLYNKEIDGVLVAGEDGYREAKDFMRMLMPSHAKSVQPYRENVPLFARFGIEAQLDRMLQPQVTLKSGGYIIINQTEALVAIDVNSGRSTKEHSIEDTALQTNLEAADEVARQLRLRDMAGLIVIDFIDMEENRNNRAVEKRMKDCLKNDRARIQVGRISHFGLLEMSRQRIRASVLESTMQPCPHCGGTGHIRSDSSVALLVLRAIEEALLKDSRCHITVKTPYNTALYMLNHKRRNLADLETQFGLDITIEADDTIGVQHYLIIKGAVSERPAAAPLPQIVPPALDEDELADEAAAAAEAETQDKADDSNVEAHGNVQHGHHDNDDSEDGQRKKRRRRRRRGGRGRGDQNGQDGASENGADRAAQHETSGTDAPEDAEDGSEGNERVTAIAQTDGEDGQRKRRRGKRGGKRNRGDNAPAGDQDGGEKTDENAGAPTIVETTGVETAGIDAVAADAAPAESAPAEMVSEEAPAKPKRTRKTPAKKASAKKADAADAVDVVPVATEADAPAKPKRKAAPRKKAEPAAAEPVVSVVIGGEEAAPDKEPAAKQDNQPRKSGWWQRKSFF